MKVTPTLIPDVLVIEPEVHGDARGFFMETFHARRYAEQGIPPAGQTFVQDNHSRSARNTLRGLHYQLTRPQGKLVRVVAGAVFDVAVDIRRGSPTFGQWVGAELSEENKRSLWVPAGFAHGFCVVTEYADFEYKCTDFYAPADERGIHWQDSRITIDWPIHDPLLSARDQQLPALDAVAETDLPLYTP